MKSSSWEKRKCLFNSEHVRTIWFFPRVLKIFVIILYEEIIGGFITVESQVFWIWVGRKSCLYRIGVRESGVDRYRHIHTRTNKNRKRCSMIMVLLQWLTWAIGFKWTQHMGIDKVWEVDRDTSGNLVQLCDNDNFLKYVFWSSASSNFAYKKQESSTMNFGMYQTLMEVIVFYTCSYKKTYSIWEMTQMYKSHTA